MQTAKATAPRLRLEVSNPAMQVAAGPAPMPAALQVVGSHNEPKAKGRSLNQGGFETMVRAYSSDLYRFAYWLCRNRWQAQDLVQETFEAAWNARDSLRDQGAMKAWLFTILRNEHARSFERKQLDIVDAELEDLPVAAPGSHTERVELENALQSLPESFREPLMLQTLGGFSGKEIAGMMGISEQNVMTRLSRARLALRRLVAGDKAQELEGT